MTRRITCPPTSFLHFGAAQLGDPLLLIGPKDPPLFNPAPLVFVELELGPKEMLETLEGEAERAVVTARLPPQPKPRPKQVLGVDGLLPVEPHAGVLDAGGRLPLRQILLGRRRAPDLGEKGPAGHTPWSCVLLLSGGRLRGRGVL